jgi:hypothetical protein
MLYQSGGLGELGRGLAGRSQMMGDGLGYEAKVTDRSVEVGGIGRAEVVGRPSR